MVLVHCIQVTKSLVLCFFPQHSLSIFRIVPILTKIDLNKPSPESHYSDSLWSPGDFVVVWLVI